MPIPLAYLFLNRFISSKASLIMSLGSTRMVAIAVLIVTLSLKIVPLFTSSVLECRISFNLCRTIIYPPVKVSSPPSFGFIPTAGWPS